MAYCAYCGSYIAQVSYAPCASCGKPSNGAPPAQRGGTRSIVAVVLIGTAGAFAFVAMLAFSALIFVSGRVKASAAETQRETMADMRVIAAALERHRREHGSFPAGADVFDLEPLLVPKYAPELAPHDGWGHDFKYEASPERYVLTSAGEDAEFEENIDLSSPMATPNYGRDIVIVNGVFMRYPEGTQ
jgi:hypothetical protein